MSFKELYQRYDEFKDMTEEELSGLIGEWWAHMFVESKDEIKSGLWRRDSDDKKP